MYKDTKVITSFVKEIKELMKRYIFPIFHVRYLEKKSAPPTDKEVGEEDSQLSPESSSKRPEDSPDKGGNGGPKNKFAFDRTKTFFRNLISMMRWARQIDTILDVQNKMTENKNQMDVSEEDLRDRYLEHIFKVPHERYLRSIQPIKVQQ